MDFHQIDVESAHGSHEAGCGSGCGGCEPGREPGPSALSPGRMSLASFAVFLLPLGLALAGAALGETPAMQALGAASGLVGGALVARLLTRLIAPREN